MWLREKREEDYGKRYYRKGIWDMNYCWMNADNTNWDWRKNCLIGYFIYKFRIVNICYEIFSTIVYNLIINLCRYLLYVKNIGSYRPANNSQVKNEKNSY